MTLSETHLLKALELPTRYEPLVKKVGPEVLNLLVAPARSTLELLEEAGHGVNSMGEGLFLPIYAPPGTGKTTLAENLTVFLPEIFTRTFTYNGALSSDDLEDALGRFIRDELQKNDTRVIPVNVDHREDRPPDRAEMSEIKRFLRANLGHRALLTWPGTQRDTANSMAESYRLISGVIPLDIPIEVDGPSDEQWIPLAAQTLELANQVDSLEFLVDLDQYDPAGYPSLGDFLRQVSIDFNREKLRLARATRKPIELTICIVSEGSGHGILSSFTSSRRYGMLDPSALLQASGDSSVGRWWAQHRGLLIQTIVTLDAHVFTIPPPLSLAVFRRYGPPDVIESLDLLGLSPRSPSEVSTYLRRSDLGRHIADEERSVGETRGNPAEAAREIFEVFVDDGGGFQGGRDKKLNMALQQALIAHFIAEGRTGLEVHAESALSFLPNLIPDVAIETETGAHCLEMTYRKGNFTTSENRGTIARYCLEKLQNYAKALGWVSPGA